MKRIFWAAAAGVPILWVLWSVVGHLPAWTLGPAVAVGAAAAAMYASPPPVGPGR